MGLPSLILLLVGAPALAVLTTLAWAMIPWTRRSQRDWEYIARVLALDVGPTQRRFPGLLHGYMAGYRLRLQSSGEGVLLTVDSQGEIPSELRIAWTSSGLVPAVLLR